MLKLMRRSANTWIIKTLLILVALSFVVWGVGDSVNQESQVPVAEGDRWVIHPREFSLAYDNEFNQLKKRFGSLDKKTAEMFGLKQRALSLLINRHLLTSVGQDLRLTIAPEALQKNIASNPAFANGGQFDPERYRQLLRSNQLTPREFEAQLAEEILSNHIYQTVGSVLHLPNLLAQDLYRLENEKRVVEMLKLKPKVLEPDIAVTDEQLTAFLQTHTERFMHPVQVKLEYALLNAATLKETITVSPEEIKEFYEENSGDFHQEERRQISHILAQVTKEAAEKGALERIQQAQARLKQGEPFADVAKALSDDISKTQGGALGLFTRQTIDPSLEKATFTLPVGQPSEPIRSDAGYHLVMVTAIQAAQAKTLEQVSNEISERLMEHKAQELVYDRANLMEERVFASGNLKAVADDLNVPLQETEFFSREEHKSAANDIEREEKFLEAAFATPAGEISAPIEIREGEFALLHILSRKEPAPKTLDEAREAVANLFKTEQAHQRATELASKALKMLQEGKSLEEAMLVHSALRTEISDPFMRTGGKGGPPPAVRMAAFKLNMTQPLHPDVLEGLEELVVVRLKKIEAADPKAMDEGVKTVRASLGETLGQEHIAAFLHGLRQEANIKVHPEVLERF